VIVIVLGVRGCVLLGHVVSSQMQKVRSWNVDSAFPAAFGL
jgi:hypothetical protein